MKNLLNLLRIKLDTLLIAALLCFILWLFVASTKVYLYTRRAAKELSSLEPYQQAGSGKKVLFVGDSFGYGTGAGTPDASLAGLVGNHMSNATIHNKSRNGTKSEDLAERISSDIDQRYDIIFVIVGANDIIHPEVRLAGTRGSYARVYSHASRHADNVVAITSPDFSDVSFFMWPLNHYFGARSWTVNRIARSEAERHKNITYIDAFDESLRPSEPKALESEDGLHLSALGNRYWLQAVLDQTDGLLFDGP